MEIRFSVFDDEANFSEEKLQISPSDSGDIEFSMGGKVLFLFPICQHERLITSINMIVEELREEEQEIMKHLQSKK